MAAAALPTDADLNNLRHLIAAEHIPVDLTVEYASATIVIHLHEVLTDQVEAHLLNLIGHHVAKYRLDRVEGPALLPRPPKARWEAAFLVLHPEFEDVFDEQARADH